MSSPRASTRNGKAAGSPPAISMVAGLLLVATAAVQMARAVALLPAGRVVDEHATSAMAVGVALVPLMQSTPGPLPLLHSQLPRHTSSSPLSSYTTRCCASAILLSPCGFRWRITPIITESSAAKPVALPTGYTVSYPAACARFTANSSQSITSTPSSKSFLCQMTSRTAIIWPSSRDMGGGRCIS